MQLNFTIKTARAMQTLGKKLAAVCPQSAVIFFHGNLGAGKTTLIRGFLRGLQYTGHVRSPTFTLLEPYTADGKQIYHFDLYRLYEAAELEFIGIRDYFNDNAICLLEWPEKGQDYLPNPDLIITIEFMSNGRSVEFLSRSQKGDTILSQLKIKNEKLK